MLTENDTCRVSSMLLGRTISRLRTDEIELCDCRACEARMSCIDRAIENRNRNPWIALRLLPQFVQSRQRNMGGGLGGLDQRIVRRGGHGDKGDTKNEAPLNGGKV
jgi:hypothetical protein